MRLRVLVQLHLRWHLVVSFLFETCLLHLAGCRASMDQRGGVRGLFLHACSTRYLRYLDTLLDNLWALGCCCCFCCCLMVSVDVYFAYVRYCARHRRDSFLVASST